MEGNDFMLSDSCFAFFFSQEKQAPNGSFSDDQTLTHLPTSQ